MLVKFIIFILSSIITMAGMKPIETYASSTTQSASSKSSVQNLEPQMLTIKMLGSRDLNGYFPEAELKYSIEVDEKNRVKFRYIPTLNGLHRSADSIRFEIYRKNKYISSISMGGGYSNISNFKSDRQNLEQ